MVVGETASTGRGGSKAQWITDLFAVLAAGSAFGTLSASPLAALG